jgi:hypothetical protein
LEISLKCRLNKPAKPQHSSACCISTNSTPLMPLRICLGSSLIRGRSEDGRGRDMYYRGADLKAFVISNLIRNSFISMMVEIVAPLISVYCSRRTIVHVGHMLIIASALTLLKCSKFFFASDNASSSRPADLNGAPQHSSPLKTTTSNPFARSIFERDLPSSG